MTALRPRGASNEIYGRGGDDRICDAWNGDAGEVNKLYGGPGNDLIVGGSSLYGQSGNDLLVSKGKSLQYSLSFTLRGGSGDDVLIEGNHSGPQLNTVFPGPGDDTVRGRGGSCDYPAAFDCTQVSYSHQTAPVLADIRSGTATSLTGHDTLIDVGSIIGSKGGDTLRGWGRPDYLRGGPGADQLVGRGGRDLLDGDDGADQLRGNLQDDRLFGGRGPDTLTGAQGNDRLDGGAQRDRCLGGEGHDQLANCEAGSKS